MKVFLIGATGLTGEAIVDQSLAQGHDITALVRDASTVSASHPHLHWVVGDILNTREVDAAMAGQDAVICSLGTGVTFKHVTLFPDGTRHLLDAMRRHAVRRIVCITGIGAGDSRGHGGFFYRALLDLTGITVGKIARADVAAFVLAQLTGDAFLRKTPRLKN